LTEKGRRQETGYRRQKGESRNLIQELEIREMGILGEKVLIFLVFGGFS